MGFSVIGNLITDARCEDKLTTVLQLGDQLAFQAQYNVSFVAPMIGQITR